LGLGPGLYLALGLLFCLALRPAVAFLWATAGSRCALGGPADSA